MIKIHSDAYRTPVSLSKLHTGDTFLLDGYVCMIAVRNGHPFVLDLSTGQDFSSINPAKDARGVIPINCELSYQVRD